MQADPEEERLLRSVALQNSRAVLLARERAERELRETKEALEQSARDLREEKERFRVTLSSIADAVITTDLQGRIAFLNPAAEAMTGWYSADAIGQPLETVFRIINGKTRQPVDTPIAKVLKDGVVVGLTNHSTLIAKDGTETAIEDSVAPIKDANGEISGAVMVFHDVTQKRKAENALRESENRKSAILDVSLDAIITMDHQGRISDFNPAAERVFGYRREDAIGQPLADLIIPERFRERHHQGLAHYLATGEGPVLGKRIEMPSLHAEGHEFPAELSINRIAGVEPPMFTATLRDITERKEAAEALRKGAEQLQLAMSAGQLGDWSWDAGTDIVILSDRAAELFSVPRGIPTTWTKLQDLLHEDDREQAGLAVERAVAEHSGYDIQYRIAHPHGEPCWVAAKGIGTYAEDGSALGMTGFVQDITEQKLAEEAIRRSEEELRALANSIPQLAWMADPDGYIFWYNQRWYEYTGTTFEQMEGWGWQTVHDPKILPSALERWKASIATGDPFEMEFPLRGADGVFRWFLTRVKPMRNAQGRVTRWFGTNTDVDEVKRANEALQEETRVLEILNNTGSAISSELSLENLVQSVTDAGTKLSGAKFGAFFYKVINDQGESLLLFTLSGAPREAFEKFGIPRNTPVFHPTFSGESVVRSGDILKDPRYGTMPPHHGMPKGHLPVRSYLSVPVISRSGEVIGGLFFGHPEPDIFTERSERLIVAIAAQAAIAIDNARLFEAAQKEIAERKRAEAELQQAKNELEQRVAERTASLQETTDQLEAFCYTIAHDLRSPLRAQQSFAQILLEDYKDKLDEPGRGYAQRIINSARRLDTLVNDLLSYSRISRSELALETVDSNRIVKNIVANLTNEIHAEQATVSIDPLLPIVTYEPTLELVITNLLTNALKFSKPGLPPKIRVWAEARGEFVRLWVEDNGIGIDIEHQKKIFGVFERLHPMEKFAGTGIGLAIVQKGVERMGGRFGVESEPGKGSRFWIELPKG